MTAIDVLEKLLKRINIKYYLSPAEYEVLEKAIQREEIGVDVDNDGTVDVKVPLRKSSARRTRDS